MMEQFNITYFQSYCARLNIPKWVIEKYDEPHRYWHNMEHIINMMISALKRDIMSDYLFKAIVYHDAFYDPMANDNEERSAALCHEREIQQAILSTKDHIAVSPLSKQLIDLDCEVLYGDFPAFMDFEHKIFKEYQWVDLYSYKKARVPILKKLGVCQQYLDYVECREPNIALMPGSFNPFTKGHLNILEKAERIFDKVILARGINPAKPAPEFNMPEILKYRQQITYDGLLTDAINNLDHDVTVVRGLRNATDFDYELNQYRWMQEFKLNLKVVNIICDMGFEHVSSSAIRQLKTFNKESNFLL